MPAGKYLRLRRRNYEAQPPHITDQPILAQMKRIGIEPGKSFDLDKADPAVQSRLESAPEDARS